MSPSGSNARRGLFCPDAGWGSQGDPTRTGRETPSGLMFRVGCVLGCKAVRTVQRPVAFSQVSSFHSEAGRRRYRLLWLQKRTPAGLSAPPEGQQPLAAFRFPPGSQCGQPGSRFPTIYHAHLVKDGPRPRLPVSERFHSDRTVCSW